MRRPPSLALFAVCIFLPACTRDGGPPIHTGEPAAAAPSSTCPFGLPGARVAVEGTNEGADVVVSAFGDKRAVRARAHDPEEFLHLRALGVPVRASEEDTADGARVHVAAVEVADRRKVRVALARRADRERERWCN